MNRERNVLKEKKQLTALNKHKKKAKYIRPQLQQKGFKKHENFLLLRCNAERCWQPKHIFTEI